MVSVDVCVCVCSVVTVVVYVFRPGTLRAGDPWCLLIYRRPHWSYISSYPPGGEKRNHIYIEVKHTLKSLFELGKHQNDNNLDVG